MSSRLGISIWLLFVLVFFFVVGVRGVFAGCTLVWETWDNPPCDQSSSACEWYLNAYKITANGGPVDRGYGLSQCWHREYSCDTCAQPTGGWTCFPAGTKVQMATGNNNQETITNNSLKGFPTVTTITNNQKTNNKNNTDNQPAYTSFGEATLNIEDVKVGDKVISQSETGEKSVSRVTKLDQPVRDHMCQINFTDGSEIKLTSEHPLFSDTGWKAIDPKKTFEEIPSLPVTALKKGDKIVRSDESRVEVKSFACWSETIQTYNLILDGGVHTYFADGLMAHNKSPNQCDAGLERICPNFPQNNYCAPACVFPDRWTGSFEVCGVTPSGYNKYWCSSCYCGVVPTPTPPPGGSPVGTLSCPSQISLGGTGSFTLSGGDADGNLDFAQLYYSLNPPVVNSRGDWNQIGGNIDCNGYSCNPAVSWTPGATGTYMVTVNYFDSSSKQCSGNPYFACNEYPVAGFDSCNCPDPNDDACPVLVCNLYNGPNGVCGSGNGVATCGPNPATCSTGTLTAIDSTGADGVFNWGCSGVAGECGGTSGSAVTCSAPHLPDIPGVCGSSNGGDFISAPGSNLCSSGTLAWVDSVGSDGVFNWSCTGQCSGVTASCTATRNFAPVFTSLTIKNNSGNTVVAESGDKNQICQTEFGGSRNVTFEVRASDPDGVADISNITVVWNGKMIPRLSAIGAVTTFGGTLDSSFNYSLPYPLEVTITDSQGQVATNSSRSFKIWDCNVPISGAIYDDSANSGCSGFLTLADDDMNFNLINYKNMSGGADVVGTVNSFSSFGSDNLIWGKSYLPLINGGIVGNEDGDLSASGRTTRLNGACPVSAQFNVEVDPYVATQNLTLDLSYIRDQESWFQGNGIDIRAGGKLTEGVPVTATNPYLVLNRGLVAAPILENTNGYNNNWHYGPLNYNWFLEEALIDPHKYSYQSIYNEYFVKMGEGVTGVTVINLGSTGVLFVNVGITISNNVVVAPNKYLMVVVNGNVTIDQTVNNVDGIYVAKNISAGGNSNTPLEINGALYATNGGEIRLNRSFTTKSDNNLSPAVVVNYRPDMIFALPGRLSKVLSGWREL